MLVLESGTAIPFGSLVRLKYDPDFPNWDKMYADKLVLLLDKEWIPSMHDYLYTVLIEGKIMYCERTDFDEEHYPG